MKKQILLVLSLILGLTAMNFAQGRRTVTNANLEKFRQTREQADKEYRATYEQRGLPSPEELARLAVVREQQLAADAARISAFQQRDYELRLRAEEVQAQRDLNNAQINYLRTQTYGYPNQVSPFVGGQVYSPSGYGFGGGISYGSYGIGGYGIGGYGFYGGGFPYGGGYYNNYPRRGNSQSGGPILPNQQIVRNAANGFPTPGAIRNQIYGTPPQQIRGAGGGGGRRH